MAKVANEATLPPYWTLRRKGNQNTSSGFGQSSSLQPHHHQLSQRHESQPRRTVSARVEPPEARAAALAPPHNL
eukprot:1758989-Prymnesium_polylepis.1